MKIYLAAPLEPHTRRPDMQLALDELREIKGFDVYAPIEHIIPNAWDYPNNEWGLMVFAQDINAIKDCDVVVALSYGRNNTSSGTNWEIGFAFGIGKKVIVVEMDNDNFGCMSLMVANGRYATVEGIAGLKHYDWENMPKTRTTRTQS